MPLNLSIFLPCVFFIIDREFLKGILIDAYPLNSNVLSTMILYYWCYAQI